MVVVHHVNLIGLFKNIYEVVTVGEVRIIKTDFEFVQSILGFLYNYNNYWDFKYILEVRKELISLMMQQFPKETKKMIKKVYKHINELYKDYQLFPANTPKLINQGVWSDDEYSESWTYWYIFDSNSIDEVEEIIDKYGNGYIYKKADRINSPYDCTGRTFSYDMWIRKVGKNRILVTKWYGLDV
jgi:hypothetical protein